MHEIRPFHTMYLVADYDAIIRKTGRNVSDAIDGSIRMIVSRVILKSEVLGFGTGIVTAAYRASYSSSYHAEFIKYEAY